MNEKLVLKASWKSSHENFELYCIVDYFLCVIRLFLFLPESNYLPNQTNIKTFIVHTYMNVILCTCVGHHNGLYDYLYVLQCTGVTPACQNFSQLVTTPMCLWTSLPSPTTSVPSVIWSYVSHTLLAAVETSFVRAALTKCRRPMVLVPCALIQS